MTEIYDLKTQYKQAINKAAEVISSGGIVAFPTETVYGLGALATDKDAVNKIFIAKGRPQDNPLIVHISSIGQAMQYCIEFTDIAKELAQAFWPGPLTIIQKSNGKLPGIVTAGLSTVGLRMPDNKAALDIIERCGPIAAPSANRSGRPSPTKAEHVAEDMSGRIPVILDGGECAYSYESTVVGRNRPSSHNTPTGRHYKRRNRKSMRQVPPCKWCFRKRTGAGCLSRHGAQALLAQRARYAGATGYRADKKYKKII